MEHGTPRQFPESSAWQVFDQVLKEKGLKREEMIYPERFMDQATVAKRKCAIKEMYKRGMSKDSLTAQTPFGRRYIEQIINGASRETPIAQGAIEPEKTDGD
jgi:hypothetical protein